MQRYICDFWKSSGSIVSKHDHLTEAEFLVVTVNEQYDTIKSVNHFCSDCFHKCVNHLNSGGLGRKIRITFSRLE